MSSTHEEPQCHVGSQTDDPFSLAIPFDQLKDDICAQLSQLELYAVQIATINQELAAIKVRSVVPHFDDQYARHDGCV